MYLDTWSVARHTRAYSHMTEQGTTLKQVTFRGSRQSGIRYCKLSQRISMGARSQESFLRQMSF